MREKATGETLTFLLRGEAILRLPVSSEHLSKETRIPSLCAVKRSVSQGLVSKGGFQQLEHKILLFPDPGPHRGFQFHRHYLTEQKLLCDEWMQSMKFLETVSNYV